jgi:protein involved in polysaccharide export with SLBB domain
MERLRMMEVFKKQREEAENNRLKEIASSNNASALSQLNTTETELQKFDIGSTYYVGIELDKALANPGGDADIVLRDGDKIFVPEYTSTVKINGEVMYPNTVSFMKGKGVNYYINQAGGFNTSAKKKATYIVYMNGNVAKADRHHKPLPGCEIVVPSKPKSSRLSLTEILSIGTSTASIATMLATFANLIK